MSQRYFRYLAGLIILVTHIANIAMLSLTGRFGLEHETEQAAAVLILAPLTLAYLVPFAKMVVQDVVEPGRAIPFLSVLVMTIMILAFSAALSWTVYGFAYMHRFTDTDVFKFWLGVTEASFGGLVGIIFESLFGIRVVPATDEGKRAQGEDGTVKLADQRPRV